jgi:hypothetical protein
MLVHKIRDAVALLIIAVPRSECGGPLVKAVSVRLSMFILDSLFGQAVRRCEHYFLVDFPAACVCSDNCGPRHTLYCAEPQGA